MPIPCPPSIPGLPDPLALIDATALFVIQVLLAQYPELLEAPEEVPAFQPRPLQHARLLFTSVRELQYAIEVYRACLPQTLAYADNADDDIPF